MRERVRAGGAVAAARLRARAEQVCERAAGERRQRAEALRATKTPSGTRANNPGSATGVLVCGATRQALHPCILQQNHSVRLKAVHPRRRVHERAAGECRQRSKALCAVTQRDFSGLCVLWM